MSRDPLHPRPQLRRASWELLDGPWDFAADPDATRSHPRAVEFDQSIVVPFAPETAASGLALTGYLRRCWYRRAVPIAPAAAGERIHLHFGAVDRVATVWIDGQRAGAHTGGYTPFTVDLTDLIAGRDGPVEIIVQADDAPRTMGIPRGKQDWWPEPHVIWYPRTTGIWQSVWLERVPATRIAALRWDGDPATMTVSLEAIVTGDPRPGDRLRVSLAAGGRALVDDEITITDVVDGRASVRRRFSVGVPGVDDPYALTWRPRQPTLIDAMVTFRRASRGDADGGDADGADDVVESYTALRTIEIVDGHVHLNGRAIKLRMALDQGYWPDSGLTAPSVEALRRDVELIRELGLHGVRKHQKVEDPRWLACCDELGVLVWEELPSAFSFDVATAADLTREWIEVVERDRNHPCIIAWVPVNESWGVPLASRSDQQRALITSLTELTRVLDPTRLVSANDGWETVGGDIVGIHDYDQDPTRIAERYATDDAVDQLFAAGGPAGRPLTADGSSRDGRAVLLTEFGGATVADDADGLFGYGNIPDADAFVTRVGALCAAVLTSEALSGYCWTQLTDTYQEANGLLHMDRTPKAPIGQLQAAIQGR